MNTKEQFELKNTSHHINRTGDLLVTNLLKKNAFCSSYEFVLQIRSSRIRLVVLTLRVKHSKSEKQNNSKSFERLKLQTSQPLVQCCMVLGGHFVVHMMQLSRFDQEAYAPIQCIHILFCEERTYILPGSSVYLTILFSFYLFSVITTQLYNSYK